MGCSSSRSRGADSENKKIKKRKLKDKKNCDPKITVRNVHPFQVERLNERSLSENNDSSTQQFNHNQHDAGSIDIQSQEANVNFSSVTGSHANKLLIANSFRNFSGENTENTHLSRTPYERPLCRRLSLSDYYKMINRNIRSPLGYYNTQFRANSVDNLTRLYINPHLVRGETLNVPRHNVDYRGFFNPNFKNQINFRSSYNNKDKELVEYSGRGLKRKLYENDHYQENQCHSENSSPNNIFCDDLVSSFDIYQEEPFPKRRCLLNNAENNLSHDDVGNDFPGITDEPFDVLDVLSFPSEWSSCALDRTGFVDISLASVEGRRVQRYFSRTSRARDFELYITGIKRVENPFLHTLYLLKKEEMECRNKSVDELFLYHGTKKKHLTNILENNLDWRLFSENHRFGQGVSFSPIASYSSHYSDKSVVKVMLLFKVLVSNSVIGSSSMIIPPNIGKVACDTSIKSDTSVVVKYSDDEFYPLYKIMYTKRTSR